MADNGSTASRGPAFGTGIVVLLALMTFANYVDRGNLATAGPLMKDEFHLSASRFGLLLSVFSWTYVPAQILAGWLSEKFNPYRTLALGLTVWSLATMLTGLAGGFATLLVLRLLLGLGESVAFPCSSKIIAQYLPAHRLGFANGMVAVGLSLGPAVGTFAGGMLMAKLGWRPVFFLFGALPLLLLWPWFAATRHLAVSERAAPPVAAPAFSLILRQREVRGAGLGHFSHNYALFFVISWLPLYLVKSRGFTVPQMAQIGGLIYLIYAASSLSTGWLTDRWMAAGASATRARKTMVVTGHSLIACAMLGCMLAGTAGVIVSLCVAGIGLGCNSPQLFAIGQTLAGPRAAGKWIGVQNALGNSAGIVGPIITGVLVDRTGNFIWAFAVAGLVALTGVVSWGVIIPRVAPIDWAARTPPRTVGVATA